MINRFLKYGVGGIFFLLPLFILPPPFGVDSEMQLGGAKLMLCFFLGNSFFAVYLSRKIHPALGIIHFVFSLSCLLTGFGSVQLYPFIYWLAGAFLALLFLELEYKTQKFLFRCIVWAAVASSALALFQALDLDPIFSYAPTITPEDRRLPVGMMGQTTKHGAFLAIAFGVALGVNEGVAAVIILAAALGTRSSFTILALLGALAVYVRYQYQGKRLIKYGVGLLVLISPAVYFLCPTLFFSHGRFRVWQTALTAWWTGPNFWLGFGPGSFSVLYHRYFQPPGLVSGDFMQAHNDYVQALFEFGVLGAATLLVLATILVHYFYFHWWTYRAGLKKKPGVIMAAECGLVAILLNAIGNFPFQLAPCYFLAILFLAIILQKSENKE